MTELWRLSASELATRIRSGDVSAKEAAQSALARLESVNPVLNAIVAYRPDAVIQRAEAVDRARARGDKLGPLAGVPVTVKINIDQRGFATTNGARSHENLIAQVNSPLVDNLEKAGAMLLGRSNSPTFALRWFTSNQRTTRDRHRYRRFDSVPRIRLRYPWNSPKPGTRAALREAARKLVDAGWTVDEIDDTPPIREAAQVQERLWLGDGFDALASSVDSDGDPGAAAVVAAARLKVADLPVDVIKDSLVRRTSLMRQWRTFLDRYAVLILPVSAELPFPDDLDRQGIEGFERVWESQLTMRALPAMGLPGLTVTTDLVNGVPVGVQIVAAHFREDLCLQAGLAIEERSAPVSAVDPVAI